VSYHFFLLSRTLWRFVPQRSSATGASSPQILPKSPQREQHCLSYHGKHLSHGFQPRNPGLSRGSKRRYVPAAPQKWHQSA